MDKTNRRSMVKSSIDPNNDLNHYDTRVRMILNDLNYYDMQARMILSEMNAAHQLDKFDLEWIRILGENLHYYKLMDYGAGYHEGVEHERDKPYYKLMDYGAGYHQGVEHERDKPWWMRLFNREA